MLWTLNNLLLLANGEDLALVDGDKVMHFANAQLVSCSISDRTSRLRVGSDYDGGYARFIDGPAETRLNLEYRAFGAWAWACSDVKRKAILAALCKNISNAELFSVISGKLDERQA